ncbi:MAG: glycoside hydrolase family 9 protein [Opitutae bacterium]|nr:glycoside hydrolase family 9 protein [Opitutae bacterium]
MKQLIRALFAAVLLGVFAQVARAVEPTWNYAVQLSAAVQASPAQISLTWPQDTAGTPVSYTVYRKAPGAASWGSGTTLAGSATSYTDTAVSVGTAYEYQIVKNAGSYNGYGYIESGINVPLVESRGKLVLVVDNTYASQLAAELTRLQQDLAGDGWTVLRHDVARNDSVASVKNLIQADYNADPANVKSVFLFGHVPVPYSGQLNPDGHPDHVGAWPADAFYGDMDGNWTDSSVNFTQSVNTDPADAARLTNKPGDGKYDQTTLPSAIELQVGRVDLANLPGRTTWGGPATFPSELELLRQYLGKDHNFRHKIMPVQPRAIVGDYFGVRGGEAFAASGYRNAAPFVGANNITNLNTQYNDQKGVWVPALASGSYLFAYGTGAGSYKTIAGLGNVGQYNDTNTVEVVNSDVHAVFTLVFGSWHGDWDNEDNIMRSLLATKTNGLAAAWSGRPHWFMHPMGLGEPIGVTARLTQNNTGLYRNQTNSSAHLVHIALMGDPSLRLFPVAPPASLGGSLAGTSVTLAWTPSPDAVLGYNVYRATSANGPFTRVTGSLLAATTFVDASAPAGATYMVRAVKLETTPSGSYYNASQGLFWSVGGAPAPVPTVDTTAPSVSLTSPLAGATVSGGSVIVSANATDNVGVVGVQFKLDGNNLGAEDSSAPFSFSWDSTQAANGPHTLSAVARDLAGNQTTAAVVTVNVSNSGSGSSSTFAWVDDALPAGASGSGTGGDNWTWVTASPAPFSGTKAHQTNLATGLHEHSFNWASATMPVATGDKLFAYIYLDPANPPSEIMISWQGNNWEHRAYWGTDLITYGTNNTASRFYAGILPATGQWVRLEVPASSVGLEGQSVTGMSFSLYNGRATWDYVGKVSGAGSTTTPPPPPSDTTAPTVSLSSPANGSTVTGGSISVTANAADNVGVAGVQFKLDGANLGTEVTAAPFTFSWDTTKSANGVHTLAAVARDAAGNTATATSVTVTVSNIVVDSTAPTVSVSAPANGSTVSGGSVIVTADASDNVGVAGVQFKLDGANLGAEDATAPYSFSWDSTLSLNGSHTLSAIARDAAGNSATATTVTVTVSNSVATPPPPTTTTDTVWVDDALPAGSWGSSTGGDTWTWITASPAPFSGTKAHQTNLASGIHEHSLNGATATLSVATGDVLFTYIYLDPANVPTEVMLSFNGNNWEHRAYWGANTIQYGTDGTASRYRVGDLPAAGQWVRLEVPASALGLEGQTLTGMSFSLVDGRATWDKSGKGAPAPVSTIPTVTVVATDASATINSTDNAVLTFARTGSTGAALAVNFILGGTAVKWNDYRTVNGDMPVAVTIPAGASSATMTIVAVNNETNANPETATFTLASDPAYTVGSASSATLTFSGTAPTPTPAPAPAPTPTPEPAPSGTYNIATIPAVNPTDYLALEQPLTGDNALRIVAPAVLELQRINTKSSTALAVDSWDFVSSTGAFTAPAASKFVVTVNGSPVAVSGVGFKRRPLYAPLAVYMLRLESSLYLKLAAPVPDGATVVVTNPDGSLWPAAMLFKAAAHPLRYSPAIHVNQEGYVPAFAKKASVGYYLGNLGELDVPAAAGFQIVDAATGNVVFNGALTARPDTGWTYSPTPYQKVYEADFSPLTTPGRYYLTVPGLGASVPFKIDEGIAMEFARTYALGLYHQRCGAANAMPYTRFVHDACHLSPAAVPSPASSYGFTWTTVAAYANNLNPNNPAQIAPALTSESAQLYPFVNQGTVDVSGGHHDAGDYSKYTINSASLVHELMFAVDSVPGVAALDNLGLPESGDGISDVLQEAKWEADFLAKMQDADGGFYFLVYPMNREYESNVTPDQGDVQVVWPKNTAASAAATAALAEIASSPRFKAAYPVQAAAYLAKAKLGWQFLSNAIAKYGKAGAYQKITHYGDDFTHDDELAWAAAAMFAATGDQTIHATLKSWFDPSNPANWRWGWWHGYMGFGNAERIYAFAATSGRLAASALDSAYLAKCQAEIIAAGDDSTTWSGQSAYGTSFPLESKRVQSAGWYFSGTQAFDITAASALTAKPGYTDAILRNLNYEGGNNPLNLSYVTGLGQKRQHEIVHQYAQNDRRDLPPSGIPLGNLQTGPVYTATYGTALASLVFPSDSAGSSPFPFYDRWSDTFNVTTEFVHLDTARSLVAYAALAAQTSLKTQAWKPTAATITGLPVTLLAGTSVTATLTAPAGIDLTGATIVWEAADQGSHYGASFTFTPSAYGQQWVEAEATLPDGRRVFAVQNFFADNGKANVSVVATDASAKISNSADTAVFTFTRTGDTSQALTVNFSLGGSAVKWIDYRRPQGDMPSAVTIPAGAASVTLTIYAVANSTGANPETVLVSVVPDATYNAGSPALATATITN